MTARVAATGAAPVPAAVAAVPASGSFEMGMSYAPLPSGAITIPNGGATYYLSDNTWFGPA